MGVKYIKGPQSFLLLNIYVPCDDRSVGSENHEEFLHYMVRFNLPLKTVII